MHSQCGLGVVTQLALAGQVCVPQLVGCASIVVPVSYSGGAFAGAPELVEAFTSALTALPAAFECRAPLYPPVVGAALHAARLAGAPLSPDALTRLRALSAAAELPR